MKRMGLFLLVNLLVLTTIIIMVTVFGIGNYLTAQGIDYASLLVFSAIVGFSGAFISLALSRWMAKKMMKVQVLDPSTNLTAGERQLVALVHQISKKAGLKVMPQVGIYPANEVNAFATGPTKSRSLIALSGGLLNNMDQPTIEGIIAHEVAHIANGDMITMTLVQGVINTFAVFLSRIIAYAVSTMVRDQLAGVVHFACVIIFQILFTILGSIAVMAFSRHREYRADAGGASLVGRAKMKHALQSLKQTVATVDTEHASIQTFKISGGKKSWLRLFASHPDLDDRINRLL
ncbi:MAG: protease HtpX [Desulfotomaculum sp.]|nr:protease HtpX [Desulfotomaculum sp.]